MFTLYTSNLPYLKQQTLFYSDVLHISQLQVGPLSNAWDHSQWTVPCSQTAALLAAHA